MVGAATSLAQEPDIDLSETTHDFGDVTVGDSIDWTLTIFNLGADTLFVDSVRTDVPQFRIESATFPDTVLSTNTR